MIPLSLYSCFMISFEVADGDAALTIEVNFNGEVVNLGTQIFKVTVIDTRPVCKEHPCFEVCKAAEFRLCNNIGGHFVADVRFDASVPIPCRVAYSINRGPPHPATR